MACKNSPGTAAGSLLSCHLHAATPAFSVGPSESPRGVWHALPGSRRNPAHPGRRSAPDRSPDRLPGGAAHRGPADASASAPALPGSRRRHRPRSIPLDPHPPSAILLARQSPRQDVSGQISGAAQPRLSQKQTPPLRPAHCVETAGGVRSALPTAQATELGGRRQGALRQPRARPPIPGSLYTPGGHLQRPPTQDARGPRDLPLEGLSRREPTKTQDAGCHRVHPSVPASHPAARLRQDSPFRLPGAPPPAFRTPAGPEAIACARVSASVARCTARRHGTSLPPLWPRNALFPRMDSRRSRYRFAGVPPGLRGFIVTLRMNCSRLRKHPRPSNTRSAQQCWECVRNSILLRWEPLFGFLPRLENHCRNLLGQPILLCRLPFRPPENRSIPL